MLPQHLFLQNHSALVSGEEMGGEKRKGEGRKGKGRREKGRGGEGERRWKGLEAGLAGAGPNSQTVALHSMSQRPL